MAVTPQHSPYQLAPFVRYHEHDGRGLFLDIRHGVVPELDERDTSFLNAIFSCASVNEAILLLSHQFDSEDLENDVFSLLERLQSQMLIEPRVAGSSRVAFQPLPVPSDPMQGPQPHGPISWKQRLVGATHILLILNELRQVQGYYEAYQSLQELKKTSQFLPTEAAFARTCSEYWWYRLVTGLVERRVAHLLGQSSGEEGLCMVRAFALCAFLLSLNIPAQIITGRPIFGARDGFKLHLWVELQGIPLNERPNIRDAYHVMEVFPF